IGQLGGAPSVEGQEINFTINTRGRLQTPEEFRAIIIRSATDGSNLTLGDVARVELGAQDYGFLSQHNGRVAGGLAISLSSGANALETAANVKTLVRDLEQYFPAGLVAEIPFDNTPFVEVAIKGVV